MQMGPPLGTFSPLHKDNKMGFGSFLKKAVGVVLPVVGAIIGGPVGAAIGSAIAGKISTGSWRGWARNAAIGGATAWAGGAIAGKGINPWTQSTNAFSGFKGGISNLAKGGTYKAGMRGATMSSGQQSALQAQAASRAAQAGNQGAAVAQNAQGYQMGQSINPMSSTPGAPGVQAGQIGQAQGGMLSNIGDMVKTYGPKAYNLATKGMKLLSATQAEAAYASLEQQMAQGGQLNQMAIDQLMQMEQNPDVYLNSPEVKAARDRAMGIVKRQAAAKGETYSTNAIQDYITQSLLVDTNAINNRRNYLQGMSGSPQQTMANLNVVNAKQGLSDQTSGAMTELGTEVFGEENMLGTGGSFGGV